MAGIDNYTKLLLHGWGANTQQADIDYSGNNHLITFNNTAQIKTDQYVYAPSSYWFDGTGDYLSTLDSVDWFFDTDSFTIEGYVRYSSVGAGAQHFFNHNQDANNFQLLYWGGSGDKNLRFIVQVATVNGPYFSVVFDPSVDTWYHLMVVRYGNIWYLFINGVSQALTLQGGSYSDPLPDITGNMEIGGGATVGCVNGNMAEIMISKGIARRISNFTPNPYPFHRTGNIISM